MSSEFPDIPDGGPKRGANRAPLSGPDEYYAVSGGEYKVRTAPSEAAYRAKTLFWIRVIGWYAVITAMLSIAGIAFIVKQYS